MSYVVFFCLSLKPTLWVQTEQDNRSRYRFESVSPVDRLSPLEIFGFANKLGEKLQ